MLLLTLNARNMPSSYNSLEILSIYHEKGAPELKQIAQTLSQTVFGLSRITRRILNPWQLACFPLSCLSCLDLLLRATCESVIYAAPQNSWKFNFPLSFE